jgi:hypothetical protein
MVPADRSRASARWCRGPDESHLWLPRNMELPHGYIARTTWGDIGLSGKSTTLFNLAMSDLLAGEGVAVIDPHGDLAEAVADCIPPERTHSVCYLDAGDAECPVGFNPLAHIAPERNALAASGMVSAFKYLWRDSWGPRLELFLFNGISALLCAPHATLIDLPRLYIDERFRERVVARVRDPIVLRFWREEYPRYDERYRAEAAGPILNKAGQFAASPALRAILGQHAPKFDLAHSMENRGILIANLAKGRVGEQAANLLGSLLISHLQLVAMGRSAQAPEKRVAFFALIDEFQSFGSDAFASLLSEARKFAAHFFLANQYINSGTNHFLGIRSIPTTTSSKCDLLFGRLGIGSKFRDWSFRTRTAVMLDSDSSAESAEIRKRKGVRAVRSSTTASTKHASPGDCPNSMDGVYPC